jgi:hypothetical protein
VKQGSIWQIIRTTRCAKDSDVYMLCIGISDNSAKRVGKFQKQAACSGPIDRDWHRQCLITVDKTKGFINHPAFQVSVDADMSGVSVQLIEISQPGSLGGVSFYFVSIRSVIRHGTTSDWEAAILNFRCLSAPGYHRYNGCRRPDMVCQCCAPSKDKSFSCSAFSCLVIFEYIGDLNNRCHR